MTIRDILRPHFTYVEPRGKNDELTDRWFEMLRKQEQAAFVAFLTPSIPAKIRRMSKRRQKIALKKREPLSRLRACFRS